jgi:hypothetical protein
MVEERCMPMLQSGEVTFDIAAALNGGKTFERLEKYIKRIEATGNP